MGGLGQVKADRVDRDAETLVKLNAIPASERKWGMRVNVYNDGTNNGNYILIYGRVDTNLSNNSNWFKVSDTPYTLQSEDPNIYTFERVSSGTWNMDTDATKTVNLSSIITTSKSRSVVSISVKIRPDSGSDEYFLPYADPATGVVQGGFDWNDNTKILTLWRLTGGFFDNTNFNDTVVITNRASIFIGWDK